MKKLTLWIIIFVVGCLFIAIISPLFAGMSFSTMGIIILAVMLTEQYEARERKKQEELEKINRNLEDLKDKMGMGEDDKYGNNY